MIGVCSGTNDSKRETTRYSETNELEMGGLQSVPQMPYFSNLQNYSKYYEKQIIIIYCSFKMKHPFVCRINDDSVLDRAKKI